MNEKTESCAECMFAEAAETAGLKIVGQNVFLCKRFPPVPVPIPHGGGLALQSTFPVVNAAMCCAEWRGRLNGSVLIPEGRERRR